MRNAGRLKLGYYRLPIDEARNIHSLLVSSAPYAAIDPCVGDGTALLEITKGTGAYLAGIELDADRVAAAGAKGVATVHGSAFECRVLAATCSLLYLNPPYGSEFEPHSNKTMELFMWSQNLCSARGESAVAQAGRFPEHHIIEVRSQTSEECH